MSSSEAELVRERLAFLVDTLQREPHSAEQAWGATYDAGLSRVHYPEGWGGLGVRAEHRRRLPDANRHQTPGRGGKPAGARR